MSQFNIYKLLEEFISKSNKNDLEHDIKILTPPDSPQIYDENDNEEKLVINEININKQNEQEIVNLKPNRPYSYYVATNFHPFENTNNNNNTTPLLQQQQPKVDKRVNNNNTKKKNRLSVSLSDIKKTSNNKTNTINLTNTEDLKQFSSQNCILNQNSKMKQFEIGNSKVKVNRLNRLLRRLFTFNRKIKSSSPLSSSTTPMTMLDQHDIHHINYSTSVDTDESSKFVRFFTSFRSPNVYSRKIDTTPIAAKESKSENIVDLPHISLVKGKGSFFFC
jgi:hypothetical protein